MNVITQIIKMGMYSEAWQAVERREGRPSTPSGGGGGGGVYVRRKTIYGSYIDPKTGMGYSMTSAEATKRGFISTPGSGGGTYDTRTGTYTDPSGLKYSLAQKYVPTGTRTITTQTAIPTSARTLAAQIEEKRAAPIPTAIYAAEDIPRGEPYRRTKREAAGVFIKRLPVGTKKIIRGFFTEMDISPGVSYLAEPFSKTGKLKGEEKITIREPQFGTITPETKTGFKEWTGTKFEFAEIQKMESGVAGKYIGMPKEAASVQLSEDIVREITPKYQAKVDQGELTVKQAESQLKQEYEKEFKKKAVAVEQAYTRQPKGLYERTGTKISKVAPSIAEIGLIATPIGGAYLVGRGFGQTVKAETTFGKAVGVATVGLGFTGIGITMSGLRASLTKGKIMEAASRKPDIKLGVRQELKEGYIRDYMETKYKVGDVSVIKETEIISKQFTKQPQLYAMTGEGSVVVRTTEEFTGRTVYYTSFAKFKGTGYGFEAGKAGFQPSLVTGKVSKEFEMFAKIKKEKPLTYKAKAELYAPSEDLTIGSISKKAEDKILSLGGEVKGIKKRWETPSGIEIERGKFTFDVEEIALLKVIKPSKEGVKRFVRPADIKKTPFAKTFGKQEQILETTKQQISPSLVSEKLTQPTITPLQKARSTTILKEKVMLASSLEMAQLSVVLTRTKIKQTQIYALSQAGFLKTDLMPKLGTSLAPQSALRMRLAELQAESSLQVGAKGLIKPKIKIKPGVEVPGGFFIPPLFPALKFGKGEAKMLRGRQLKQYQPSLTAASLGITATKIPKSYHKGAGALTLRPIIRKGRKY